MLLRRTGLFVLLLLSCAAIALAQLDTASIVGTVSDASGAVVPGATVSIQNVGTSATVKLTTDSSGAFAAPSLPVGTYKVTATAAGFKTYVQDGVRLSVADVIKVAVQLSPGDVNEQVTVLGEVSQVQTASSTLGGVVNTQQVMDLPVNGRALATLLETVPGVSMLGVEPSIGGGGTGRLFEAGARTLLDGTDSGVTDSDFFGAGYQSRARIDRASIESIGEVRIQSNSFTAEYGQASGGVINYITKSGTNEFHGSLFEYFRNEKLDSRDYFNPAPAPKPGVRLNQFGGSVGGPIIRDKTFFFFNYEGNRERRGVYLNGVVPTQAFRNTLIPALKPAVDLLPLPNGPTSAADPRLGQYTKAVSNQLTEDTFGIKVDHNFTVNDRLSVRFNSNKSNSVSYFGIGNGQQTIVPYYPKLGKITYTRTISPTLLNEAGFAIDRVFTVFEPANDPAVRKAPIIAYGSGIPNGGPDLFDLVVGNMSETYLDTLSWVKGRHQIKFGGQILRDQINKDTKFQQLIAFLGLGTSPGFFGSNTPFLIENIGNPTVGQRETMVNLFAQDDFQATRNLTLNIGLRYQYETAPTEAHGRNTNFDFATGKLETPGTSVFDAPKLNFGPRFGFAWTPIHGSNFVVRGGYGIFFTSINPAVTQFEPANNPAYSFYRLVTIFDNPALTAFPATDISNGPVAGFFVPIPKDFKTPYTHSWNLNLQQGIGQSTLVQLAYIGSAGRHFAAFTDPNRIDPVTKKRPYPNFGSMLEYFPCCNTSYNALQASLKRRLARGLAFNVNYTWSHSLDQGEWGFATRPNNDHRLDLEHASSDYDIRHQIEFDYTYEIPALPAIPKIIGGGWQLNGISVFRSGVPVNVYYPVDTAGVGTDPGGLSYQPRPNLVPGVDTRPSNYGPSNQINVKAFAPPADGTFGNLGRNVLRGLAVYNWDFSLFKAFPVYEKSRLEFRAEFFNIFNTPQFAAPQANLAAPATFGQSLSTISSAGGYFGSNRQIQFALKFLF